VSSQTNVRKKNEKLEGTHTWVPRGGCTYVVGDSSELITVRINVKLQSQSTLLSAAAAGGEGTGRPA